MKEITTTELNSKLRSGEKVSIIDVREPAEVATGKIPEAINISLRLIEFRLHELDKQKEYFIICQSGGRSNQAAQILNKYGYRVVNVIGGMQNWEGKVE
ncbi:rhodanese-like domain-containing protein [Niallia circulans]|jgi:rhodanese-related sulfurtransferase|uniref:Rhodanese domain protein n=1 Tax=Niallia circulans TaxID=1397 RepID=A0A0J1ILU5_NIACI|nr:rhodanese-like domain-containing protein [Niallia circulans]KLV26868.1 rhodanese domain protein [Niallia circulans]MDR4316200.1 rhodanese-like domain-containing protein [Niallia circulans]MED3839185.1 rhodanese-like domain-containing protein [Niallia circulans]MED4245568.1 rhodanese-like domain-containing protein [Niallia circulans]MED4250592.1 rhodanese-like domain-containing protein [Niallia circulans]